MLCTTAIWSDSWESTTNHIKRAMSYPELRIQSIITTRQVTRAHIGRGVWVLVTSVGGTCSSFSQMIPIRPLRCRNDATEFPTIGDYSYYRLFSLPVFRLFAFSSKKLPSVCLGLRKGQRSTHVGGCEGTTRPFSIGVHFGFFLGGGTGRCPVRHHPG